MSSKAAEIECRNACISNDNFLSTVNSNKSVKKRLHCGNYQTPHSHEDSLHSEFTTHAIRQRLQTIKWSWQNNSIIRHTQQGNLQLSSSEQTASRQIAALLENCSTIGIQIRSYFKKLTNNWRNSHWPEWHSYLTQGTLNTCIETISYKNTRRNVKTNSISTRQQRCRQRSTICLYCWTVNSDYNCTQASQFISQSSPQHTTSRQHHPRCSALSLTDRTTHGVRADVASVSTLSNEYQPSLLTAQLRLSRKTKTYT